MTETKKPRFNHIAVNGKTARTGQKYAKDLSAAMNKLIEAGYSVQLNELEHFTLVMGVADAPTEEAAAYEHPMTRFMRAQAEQQQETAAMGPRTRELLARFQNLSVNGSKVEDFIAEVKKHAMPLARGFDAEELAVAVKELEAVSVLHEKDHGKVDCAHARALRAIAEALRGVVHTQLA